MTGRRRGFFSIQSLTKFIYTRMQITTAADKSSRVILSAFPRHQRPFSEPISATKDDEIGPGLTIPDLIRRYYPRSIPSAFQGPFGFLSRDNKVRAYSPEKEDPFVFNSAASIPAFKKEAHRLIAHLTEEWESMGWPTTKDEDRGIIIPDTQAAWDALDPAHPRHRDLIRDYEAICFIVGNIDIMKKASIVRGISVGWWCASYRGKTTEDSAFFETSLRAHELAFRRLAKSAKFSKLCDKLWAEASDPLDTNPGYPFFNANVDSDGNPVTRIKTIATFPKIGEILKWDDVLEYVDHQAGRFGLKGHPFAIAPLRRLSAGYKWNHQFFVTPSGMRTAYDEKGENSQRVAWMVPYVYNLLLTPFHVIIKALRIMLPGLYHDGEIRRERMKIIKQSTASGRFWLAEADYSNYDRYIPVDLIERIIKGISALTPAPGYWEDATMYLHRGASLLWPDYNSLSDKSAMGWAFKPGLLGVLSGVKWTSEAGSLVNSIVNAEALARSKQWSVSQLADYLSMYSDAPIGSKYEYYYVQSDDTQLINESPKALKAQGEAFISATKAAGLKGSLELGDRFLMRSMLRGGDRPVPARVWQNTLSNETPPENETVFLAGLAARTDGLLGLKTVDPFGTGTAQTITLAEARFTREVLRSLHSFVSTARLSSPLGVRFLNTWMSIFDAERSNFEGPAHRRVSFTPASSRVLNDWRRAVTQLLAEEQLKEMNLKVLKGSPALAWLYQLFKDRHVPSSAILLDQLKQLNPELVQMTNQLLGMEHAFFLFAIDRLRIKPIHARIS